MDKELDSIIQLYLEATEEARILAFQILTQPEPHSATLD